MTAKPTIIKRAWLTILSTIVFGTAVVPALADWAAKGGKTK